MNKKSWFLSIVFICFTCISANAITLKFNGFIADEANLLSESVENDLNMTLWNLQKKSGADLVVVTLPSLNGRTVEDVAIDIGRSYKLGAVGKNNGMVYLTALNERKMRIEQGIGLENKISVSTLKSIMNEDILPYYKQNNYEAGIQRGTYLLVDTIAQVEGVTVKRQGICPTRLSGASDSSSRNSALPWWAWPIIIIMPIFSPRKRSFNSSGFGGFGGGGGFGGSGCSGSW